ncbi:MAG: hypothetical protein ACOYNI_09575 [Acidimicrobiia bacterium]
MNRTTLRAQLESTLGPHNSWGEAVVATALVWSAQIQTRRGTLFARRRRRALLLTDKRLRLYDVASKGQLVPVVDLPFADVAVGRVRRFRLMVAVQCFLADTTWVFEFRPRDRQIARVFVDTVDTAPGLDDDDLDDDGFGNGAPAPAADATPDLVATMPVGAPAPTPASAPLTPPPLALNPLGFPPPPPAPTPPPAPAGPRPEMLLTVLAMGDPSAVPALAEIMQGGFPPPKDPIPKVDRLSVRNVANQLRERRCSVTEAQRWAAVVQRALRAPNPPIILDPFDPFPDQLVAAIVALGGLTSMSDPDATAEQVLAAIEGRSA